MADMANQSTNEYSQQQQQQEQISNEELSSPSFFKSIRKPNWFVVILMVVHFSFLSHSFYFSPIRILFDIYFVCFIWFPIGTTLAKATGTKKYILFAIFNYFFLYIILNLILFWMSPFNLFRITPFALFETLLYIKANREQSSRLCFIKIPNKFNVLIVFILVWTMNRFYIKWLFIPLYIGLFNKILGKIIQISEETIVPFYDESIQKLSALFNKYKQEEISYINTVNRINNIYDFPISLTKPQQGDINTITDEQLQSHLSIK